MRRKHLPTIAVLLALVAAACTEPAPSTSTTSTTVPVTAPSTTTAGETSGGATAGADGIGDEYYPTLGNGGFDIDHYDLAMTYLPADNALQATVSIEAAAIQDLTSFNLDFEGFDITNLTVDDAPAGYERIERELIITPASPLANGDHFTVMVEYEGFPGEVNVVAMPRFSMGWRSGPSGEQYVVAEPDAANSWFPANDHPLDKATFTYRVTVPEGWAVGSNGEFLGTEPGHQIGDTITYSWEMDDPMAPYLATVIIGEGYELVDDQTSSRAAGVPVRNFLPPDLVEDAPDVLLRTGEMIAALEDAFGPYPFDEYGISVVGDFPAALENQTMSIFGRGIAESPVFEFVLVHELAHQWFGDSVSVGQWKDIWLNEGFATYAELLWVEHSRGRGAYEEVLANRRQAVEGAGYPLPGQPPRTDLFNGGVYQLGGLLLADLREEIGDDAFFELVRTHAQRFANSTAVTADFIGLAEEISGRSLEDFFNERLYGT